MNYIIFSVAWMAVSFVSFNLSLSCKKNKKTAYTITAVLAFCLALINALMVLGVI